MKYSIRIYKLPSGRLGREGLFKLFGYISGGPIIEYNWDLSLFSLVGITIAKKLTRKEYIDIKKQIVYKLNPGITKEQNVYERDPLPTMFDPFIKKVKLHG